MIIANMFGATGMTDALCRCNKNPILRHFWEGSLGTVFIPIYNPRMEEEEKNG